MIVITPCDFFVPDLTIFLVVVVVVVLLFRIKRQLSSHAQTCSVLLTAILGCLCV